MKQLVDDLGSTDKFAILAFPCNQFGSQEPEDVATIKQKMGKKYGLTQSPQFQWTKKVKVNGNGATPIYQWLRKVTGKPAAIKWNFMTAWIVSSAGEVTRHDSFRWATLSTTIKTLVTKSQAVEKVIQKRTPEKSASAI